MKTRATKNIRKMLTYSIYNLHRSEGMYNLLHEMLYKRIIVWGDFLYLMCEIERIFPKGYIVGTSDIKRLSACRNIMARIWYLEKRESVHTAINRKSKLINK